MRKHIVLTALAATLAFAPAPGAVPAAQAASQTPGSITAIGEVCAAMLESVMSIRDQLSHQDERAAGIAELNRSVALGYDAIDKILKLANQEDVEPVGGDTLLGWGKLAATAAGVTMGMANLQDEDTTDIEIVNDIYFGCRKTMKQKTVIYPSLYPYGVE